jgi:ABC-type antimicrobial peptide transport system permease subunit
MPLEPAIKAAIRSVEPSALIPDGQTLEAGLGRVIAPKKFNMLLFTVLGLLALAIAATGVYGLLAQQVEQDRSEIGIRIALGARSGQILALVLARALTYLGGGIAAGLAGAWYLATFVEAFLFQMTPYEAPAYLAAGILLLTAGMAAALVPALRAMRVDPMITLKAA